MYRNITSAGGYLQVGKKAGRVADYLREVATDSGEGDAGVVQMLA